MKDASENLAGRVGIVDLLGLSDAEICGFGSVPYTAAPNDLMERISGTQERDLNEIYRRIFRGSMPELYANQNMDRETYYSAYVNTYLQRDIRDLTQGGDEMGFFKENLNKPARAICERSCVRKRCKNAGILDECQS